MKQSHQHQITPLSPVDCIFVGPGSYPIEFAFFYDGPISKSRHGNALELAWQHLAQDCPILKSQLTLLDGRYVFSCMDTSMPKPISWHKCDGSVHPKSHQTPFELMDPVTTAPGESLATLKITEGDDGTTVGFSLSHAVADGFTYFMILNALAAIMREVLATGAVPKVSPISMNHERLRLTTNFSLASHDVKNASRNLNLPGFTVSSPRRDIPRTSIRYAQRHFTKSDLSAIYHDFSEAPKRLSTNDMICAALWREFARDFDLGSTQTISLVAPVDFRRIYHEFPRNYAGNAVVLARVDLERHRVVNGSLIEIAMLIRDAVSKVNENYVDRTIVHLMSDMGTDHYAGLGHVHIVDPDAGLLITNLSRMSFASLDFGTGAPSYCRPLTPCQRAIVLLSDGADGIMAHIHF